MRVTTTEIQGIMLDFYHANKVRPNAILMPADSNIQWITLTEGAGKFSRDEIERWFGVKIIYAAVSHPRPCIL